MKTILSLKNYLLFFLYFFNIQLVQSNSCAFATPSIRVPSFIKAPTATQATTASAEGLLPLDVEPIKTANKRLIKNKGVTTLLQNIKNNKLACPDCDLRGFNFKGRWLNGFDFRCAQLDNCNFDNARLAGADFRGASLKNSSFNYCSAPCANFKNADLSHDTHQQSTFAQAQLEEAIFDNSNLTNVTFSFANLKNASFKNALCMGTTFLQNTDLCCADFLGAQQLFNLDWKNTKSADKSSLFQSTTTIDFLKKHNLDMLVKFCNTRLPDGNVIPGIFDHNNFAQTTQTYGCSIDRCTNCIWQAHHQSICSPT
jgi:uncharacterized protein YjbI with pentapeptide repeats